MFENDLHPSLFKNNYSCASTLNLKRMTRNRAFPVVGIRCGCATRIRGNHLYIRQVESFAFNLGTARPGFFERPSNGLFSDEVSIVEAKNPIVVDHVFNEVECFRAGDIFETVEKQNDGFFGDGSF